MQKSSMWKLGALAGVVALGFFAVYQTQRGLQDESPTEDGSAAVQIDPNAGEKLPVPEDRVGVAQREPKTAPLNNPFEDVSQREPTAAMPHNNGDGPGFRGDADARFGRSAASTPTVSLSRNSRKKSPSGSGDNPFGSENVEDGFQSKPAKTAGFAPGRSRIRENSGDSPLLKLNRGASGEPKSETVEPLFGAGSQEKPPAAKTASDSPRSPFDSESEETKTATAGDVKIEPKRETATPTGNPFDLSDKHETPKTAAKTASAPKSEPPGASHLDNPFGTLPGEKSKPMPAGSDGPSLSGGTAGSVKAAEVSPKTAVKDTPFTSEPPPKPADHSQPRRGDWPKTASKSEPKNKSKSEEPAAAENPFAGSNEGTRNVSPKKPDAETEKKTGAPFGPSPKSAGDPGKPDDGKPPKSLYEPSPKKDVAGAPRTNAPRNSTAFPDAGKKDDAASPNVVVEEPKTSFPKRSGGLPELKPVPNTGTPATPAVTSRKTDVARTPATAAPATSEAPQPRGPQVTIHKTAPRNAVLGKPFVYDILIKNVGGKTAHTVVVQDPIPSGVRLEGTDPQAYLSGNKLVWKLGSLAVGESRKISVKVTPVRAGQIGSVATVNFVAQTAAQPAAQPKIVFQMQGPQQAKIGEKVTYRFMVSNVGSATAKDVWLRDIIPNGLKHPAGDDLEYKIGTLAAGKTERISLAMTVSKAGRMTNRAFITAAGGVRVEASSAVSVFAPKLVISRTGPSQRIVGRPAVYQNMVSNRSAETVNKATLVESVPTGMDFVAASDGGKFDSARRTVAWSFGPLGPGKSRTVRLQLLPKKTGTQSSVVQAFGTDGSTVQTVSATKVVGYAALGVDVPALDRPVNVGEQVTLRVIGSNRGTAAAANVKLKVTLPPQLSLVSVRGRGKYKVDGRTITFDTIDKLPGKNRAVYDLAVKAIAQGDSRVQVQIQSDEMSKPLHREEAVLVLPASP